MSKRILFFLIVTSIVIGCSNNTLTPDSSRFTPPAWIIGTWKEPFNIIIFLFRTDNVIMFSPSSDPELTIDFKKVFARTATTENVNNDSEYTFTLTGEGLTKGTGLSNNPIQHYHIT